MSRKIRGIRDSIPPGYVLGRTGQGGNGPVGLIKISDLIVQSATQAVAQVGTIPAGANPTATGGPAAINGSATTFMRSDAAPAIQKASNSQFGLVEGDGTTITIAAGVASIPSSVPLSGSPTTTTQAASDNSTKIATTAFVQSVAAGINPAIAVQAATTQASDTSGLAYNNGASGIGATLTGTANTAITIDGYTFTAVGQRLLVKNDTQSPSGAFNGIYFLSVLQAMSVAPVFTRALDYDQPSDINNTGIIPVINGTANAQTTWAITSTVNTIGTDPLTFVQYSKNPANVVTAAANLTANALQIGDDGARGIKTLANVAAGQVLASGTPPAYTATPSVTSITFGAGTALSSYSAGTFTPTITCGTPGDLVVSYTTASGTYQVIGGVVIISIRLVTGLTYTTASGQIIVASLPYAPQNGAVGDGAVFAAQINHFSDNTSARSLNFGAVGGGVASLSGVFNVAAAPAAINIPPSGSSLNISISGTYYK